MKVPFLKGRISAEFEAYLAELKESVDSNVASAKTDPGKELFNIAYPLFALLRCLSSSRYVRNPSKEIVLNELLRAGSKVNFLAAVQKFNEKQPFDKELKKGLQRQAFTGFFNELFSDALLLVNSYYTSNYRGANIAIRCMCEDLYRHLYYLDHPQEYHSISKASPLRERELGLSPARFREFLPRIAYLEIFGQLTVDFSPKMPTVPPAPVAFDLFGVNERIYSDASSAVHGSASDSHNAFRSNADMKFNESRSRKVVAITKDFVHMAVAFLTAAHLDYVSAFDEYEKSIVLCGYTPTERGALRKALNI